MNLIDKLDSPVQAGAPRRSPSAYMGLLAAIDIGSNSFRLEIGSLQRGRYKRSAYLKQMVRLGAGLDAEGHLSEEAAQRGLECLRGMASRLAGFAPHRVRAVATQTLREARNRNAFLLRAQEALGHPIEIISGREEARLIYAGVVNLQPKEMPRLVIDIGGRSTEVILGQGRHAKVAESFSIGCVSLSMRFFPDGEITAEGFRQAQVAAGAEIEESLQAFARRHWQEALGSSGTVGAVSQLLAASGITDGRITPEALRWCIEQLIAAGHTSKIDFPGLKPERRAVLPGGLAILYTLATHFDIDALQPAKGALRQGVIVDLHGRLLAAASSRIGDLRDKTVADLQRRFAVDQVQARRVRQVAMALYAQVQPRASASSRMELGWACDLHEIGFSVSHHDHHRHSAYLVTHLDAAGFSQNQQRRVADLVLAQRGGLRKVQATLSDADAMWQVLCIRLAVIKCHARRRVNARVLKLQLLDPKPRPAAKVDKSTKGDEGLRLGSTLAQVQLLVGQTWATSHPRTAYLLKEEASAWTRTSSLRLSLDLIHG
jgi:exopolyphosphatase/guanosine-5'-triphosphate,3'-diphosphate pyrophosphatase